MEKHEDGSVTLTKEEYDDLRKAYDGLYRALNSMPSFIGDFLGSRASWLRVEKWKETLAGRTFKPEDWE